MGIEYTGYDHTIRPYLGLATGIVAVSFASIFIRLAEAPSLVIAASRLTIASLILAPAAFIKTRVELRGLTREDLGCRRPGTGISPMELPALLGRRVTRDLSSGHRVLWEDLRPR